VISGAGLTSILDGNFWLDIHISISVFVTKNQSKSWENIWTDFGAPSRDKTANNVQSKLVGFETPCSPKPNAQPLLIVQQRLKELCVQYMEVQSGVLVLWAIRKLFCELFLGWNIAIIFDVFSQFSVGVVVSGGRGLLNDSFAVVGMHIDVSFEVSHGVYQDRVLAWIGIRVE
jgi:hypothetical protein